MRILRLTILFSLLCVIFTANAQQNPQPYFRNYGTDDGLPSPEVYCVLQDNKGYMWFGTDNGAVRFDGYDFKTFGASDGLLSNVVFDIYEDQQERIWFGTMTGEIFIMDADSITPYPYNDLIKSFEGKSDFAGLLQLTEDGTAWVALLGYGFLKIDSKGQVDTIRGQTPLSTLVIHMDGFSETIHVGSAWKNWDGFDDWFFNEYQNQNIYIFEVIMENEHFLKRIPKPINPTFEDVREVQKLPTGQILLQSKSSIFCLRDTQMVWSIPFGSRINEVIPEENGTIWMCLEGGEGLRKYADLEAVRQNKYEQFLDGLSISKVFKDRDNGLWVTTIENGIYHSPNPDILTYNSETGFTDDIVTAVTFENDSTIFAGCYNGDIFQLNNTGIKKIGVSPPSNHCPSLLFDPETQKLWVGGIYFQNGRKNSVTYIHPVLKSRHFYTYNSFTNLNLNGNRWIIGGNYRTGLVIQDRFADTLVFTASPTKLRGRIYGLYSDLEDRIWIGSADGIFEFRDSNYVHPGIQHPAFHKRVEDITGLPDSTIVFGTKGFGVICWKEDDIRQITQVDGLTSNMIEDVHTDVHGNIWVGTLNGLNKIFFDSSGEPIVRRFTLANGLPTNEILQINSHEGKVWLCTPDGLVKFAESSVDSFAIQPIIEQVVVNGIPIDNRLRQSFGYDKNNFEIHFLAINYNQGREIPYRYRLNDEERWQVTRNRAVNFSALSKGDYIFEVQAQNEDGVWSASSTYPFSVLPPWWMTTWFRLVAFFLVVAMIVLIFVARLRQQNKEAEVRRQLYDLEKSALQAQMNPHFIFNCLNSIQNFILQNDRKKAVEYLSRFAKLVRHNLDVSRNGKVSLEQEVQMLEHYLSLERERFNHSFDYDIYVDPVLKDDYVEFPSMLVQPFVENAILHGIGGKKSGGIVEVTFGSGEDQLFVKVRDNGEGYLSGQKDKKVSQHKSAGMSITQKRLEILGASDDNAISMQELKDEAGQIKGTEVSIKIYLNKIRP